MDDLRKNGQTSNIIRMTLINSTTGNGMTGLTSASSGLVISTIASNEASATAYTAAGSTVETIATLGTFAAPTATKCRFKEVDATNHPGLYELQFADARFAVASAKYLYVTVSGVTDLRQKDYVVEFDSPTGAALSVAGLTASDVGAIKTKTDFLPSATAGATGGLPILFDVGGVNPGVNVAKINDATCSAGGGTISFPAVLASPTNITAGTITNVTNAPFTFTGARAVTITITDDAGTPVPLSGALVRVTQSGDSELKQTNASGVVTFSLDDGNYTLSITNGAAYTYTPETITVSAASTSFSKEMTTNAVTTPSAGQCTGTLLVLDPLGAPESGVTIYFEAKGTGTDDGYSYDGTRSSSTSNGSGIVSRLFPSGSVPYRYRRGTTGNWVDFTTAATSGGSFTIPSSVGKP
jgi:hypothetical protein